MNAQVTRRQHHLARFILRNFADQGGMLWLHQRGGPPTRVSVNDAGVVRDLYSRGGVGEPKDDSLEHWLADHVDGPASVVRRILETDSFNLSDDERRILAMFVGAQDLRTPTARDHVIDTMQGMYDEWWETFDVSAFKSELESSGDSFSEEDIEAAIEEYDKTLDMTVWLDFFSEIQLAADAVAARGWVLVHAPSGYHFLTNDVGLVKFAGDVKKPASPKPGFNSGGSHWVMPLSPTRALAVGPGDSGVATSSSAMVKSTNHGIVATADRFVYSRLRSGFVEKCWSYAA